MLLFPATSPSAPSERARRAAGRARAPARERAPAGIVGLDADRDPGEHRDVRRNAQELAHLLLVLDTESVDTGCEAFVCRREEDQHERGAVVDMLGRIVPHHPAAAENVAELHGPSPLAPAHTGMRPA